MQPNSNAQPAAVPAEQKPAKKTMEDWLQGKEFKEALRASLPSHMTPDRFVRVALTAMIKNPDIRKCTQESLFKVFLDCSSLGLEPDGRRAHIIPYGNVATLIIDYKGYIELSKRSGEVKNWRAEVVCEKDYFLWENGIVTHKVDWREPRGKAQAYYSHVKNSSDVDDFDVMTIVEVQKIRARSKSPNKGAWVTDFDEMAKKTVMRRHSKRVTISPEFADALEKDGDRFDDLALELPGEIIEVKPSGAEEAKNDLKAQAEAAKADAKPTEAPAEPQAVAQ